MRVLFIAGSYPPEACGVGDYTQKLARALASCPGVNVAVVAKHGAEIAPDSSTEVIAAVEAWELRELTQLVKQIRAWSPDIVHIQYPTQGFFHRRLPLFLPIILRVLGFRIVETWHEPPPRTWRAMIHFLSPLLGVSGLIFVRPAYLDFFTPRLRRWLSCLPTRVIENAAAVPVSKLGIAEKQALRDDLSKGYARLLVFFGFVNRNKGLDCLLDAAEPGVDRVIIAGKVGDEAYVQELLELAKEKNISEAVSFTGFLLEEDAADLLAAADAVVLPFIDGGGSWNTSLHSAVLQGTFVVTTGFNNLGFDSDRNVFVVRPGDVMSIRFAVKHFSGRKIDLPFGDSGWQRIANSHIDFYRDCIPG